MRSKKKQSQNTLLDFNKIEKAYMKIYKKVLSLSKGAFEQKLKEANEDKEKRDWRVNKSITDILNYKLLKNKEYIKLKLKFFENKLEKYTPKNKQKYGCFKDYTFEKEIGRGAYGITYLVEKNNKKYLIKLINLEIYISDPWSDIHEILREINNHKEMSKLGVAPEFYGSYICDYENSPHVFIVMEYMTEGTLNDYLKDNKLTTELKNELNKKIKIMHSHGILHRDLHNSNILLTKKDNKIHIYVADFGKSITNEEHLKEQQSIDVKLAFGTSFFAFVKSFDSDIIAFNELFKKHIII